MSWVRRTMPWLASAALHAAMGGVAFLAVARVATAPAPDPDATYTVTLQPGGGARIAESPRFDDRSYGVPHDTVTIDEKPLAGVPDLPVTSNLEAATQIKTRGTGEPGRTYRPGPVVRFTPEGGGGAPEGTPSVSTAAKGSGPGVGSGRDEGVEAIPVETPSPAYPDAARRRNDQGTVIAEIRIDAQGRVESARTAAGSGSALLDEAALAAVKSWKYKPATLGGKAVPSIRRVRFVFRLE